MPDNPQPADYGHPIIEDVQCGRCGSSMSWEWCDGCDGGYYEDDDPDGMLEPVTRTCPACGGRGGWWHCLSDFGDEPTWCAGNPRPGRLNVPCSAREQFAVYADGTSRITSRSWTDDLSDHLQTGSFGARDA